MTLLALAAAGELRATIRKVKPNWDEAMIAPFGNAGAQAAKAPHAGTSGAVTTEAWLMG